MITLAWLDDYFHNHIEEQAESGDPYLSIQPHPPTFYMQLSHKLTWSQRNVAVRGGSIYAAMGNSLSLLVKYSLFQLLY